MNLNPSGQGIEGERRELHRAQAETDQKISDGISRILLQMRDLFWDPLGRAGGGLLPWSPRSPLANMAEAVAQVTYLQ
jgi:hypothetical protein